MTPGEPASKRKVDWVRMNDDEDWLMRPVAEGMCRYESLTDGSVDLMDIARMNECLDVRYENQKRFEEANKE